LGAADVLLGFAADRSVEAVVCALAGAASAIAAKTTGKSSKFRLIPIIGPDAPYLFLVRAHQ
jgi:hypothetical protein